MNKINVNVTVDARGLSCPMPVVKAKKGLDALQPGEVMELLATDKGSSKDLQAWATSQGHEVRSSFEQDGVFHFYIVKR